MVRALFCKRAGRLDVYIDTDAVNFRFAFVQERSSLSKTDGFSKANPSAPPARGRRNLLQHFDDRLPGGADRSVVSRPDRGHDLSADRQLRHERARQESRTPHVRGFVIEELSESPSNWRSEMSLEEYLRRWQIPGVQGIDTRALTRHLRERGAMKACLTTEEMSAEQAVRRAHRGRGRDRDGLRAGGHDARRLPMGSGRQDERRLVGRERQQTKRTNSAAGAPPHRRLRLRDQGKHPAPAAAERLRSHRRAGDHDR